MKNFAQDQTTGRNLLSLYVDHAADLPNSIDVGSPRFACLLLWDSTEAAADEITGLIHWCLRAGASYVMCWGPGCERVDALVDEILCDPSKEFSTAGHVMTTSHADQPISEAIWFLLRLSWPDDTSFEDTRASLAITVGHRAWADEVDEAFADPDAFVDSTTAADD